MSYLVDSVFFVEKIASLPANPSNMTIECSRRFVPTEEQLSLVFHESLHTLDLRIKAELAELPWMLGLFGAENVGKLSCFAVRGHIELSPLHTNFAHLGLTRHLTTSLTDICFDTLLVGKKVGLMLSKSLRFLEVLKVINFTSCHLTAPGALIEAVDHIPIFGFGLRGCSSEQDMLRCRFAKHREKKAEEEIGYFHVTEWSVNSKLQEIVNRHIISIVEKCSQMKTSSTMINRLSPQGSILVGRLEYVM